MLPTIERDRDEQRAAASRVQRGRGRIGPRIARQRRRRRPVRRRARVMRRAPARAAAGPGRSDLVAEAERRDAGDRRAVDERAVRAAEVLDVPAPAAKRQHRVLGRRELVLDDDRVVDVAAERRDRVEVERAALLRLAARATRRRRAGRAERPARAPPPAGRGAATGRPARGTGTAGRGTGAGRPR